MAHPCENFEPDLESLRGWTFPIKVVRAQRSPKYDCHSGSGCQEKGVREKHKDVARPEKEIKGNVEASDIDRNSRANRLI